MTTIDWSTAGGSIYSSGTWSGTISLAFDKDTSQRTDAPMAGSIGSKIGYNFPTARAITTVTTYSHYYAGPTLANAYLKYSDNGTDWTQVGDIERNWSNINVGAHKYWVLEAGETVTVSGNTWQFGTSEIEMMEEESLAITISNYNKSKISDESGMTTCTVTFQSNKDLLAWEARATDTGITPARGVGLLVGSGTGTIINNGYTADLCTGGTAISGGDYGSKLSAFDNSTATYWRSTQTSTNISGKAYIGYHFSSAVKICKITYTYRFASQYSDNISSFLIQGSNDGTTWTTVYTVNSQPTGSMYTGDLQTIEFTNTTAYSYWRLLANANTSSSFFRSWGLYELEMMGINYTTTPISANTDISFDVDYTELTDGDMTYTVKVYGQDTDGDWSDVT
jgi:hypothetical protein